jgi:hypothetical protein
MRREKAPPERHSRRFCDTYHDDDDQTQDGIKISRVVDDRQDDRDKDKITTRLESIGP